MTKEILAQYCDLREEVKDLRKRIQKLEGEILKIEDEGAITDTVSRGKKGKKSLGTVKISGFPYPEYSKKKTRRYMYKAQLEMAEEELLELTSEVEEYIQLLPNSRIRRIIRFVFIDDLTYIQTAHRMGGRATADSIRMELKRFLEKQ